MHNMPTWATKMSNTELHPSPGPSYRGALPFFGERSVSDFLSSPVASGHHPGDSGYALRCAWQST